MDEISALSQPRYSSLQLVETGRHPCCIQHILAILMCYFPRFSIRSKINPNQHWYYDEGLGCILVSDTKRTLFKISALDMQNNTIMIGSDDVTLVAQHHGFVVPNESSVARVLGVTGEESQVFKFKFKDLKEGKFIPGTESIPSPLCYVPQGGAGTGWVLV